VKIATLLFLSIYSLRFARAPFSWAARHTTVCLDTNDFARRLSEDLERQGFETFLDTGNITIGDALPQNITKGIKNCDGMIIIYTKNYCSSDWCPKELDYAVDQKKQLYPLKRQDVEYERGSWHLSRLLYQKFYDEESYAESLWQLISAIKMVHFLLCVA